MFSLCLVEEGRSGVGRKSGRGSEVRRLGSAGGVGGGVEDQVVVWWSVWIGGVTGVGEKMESMWGAGTWGYGWSGCELEYATGCQGKG